jgi:hypothetical protein
MTTIIYTPKDALHNPPANQKASTVLLKEAVQLALDTDIAATRQAARAIDIQLSNDSWTSNARYGFARMPVAGTVTSIHWVAKTNSSAAGTVLGSLVGALNNLQNADLDLKTGINDTLKAATLTTSTANLTLAAGALLAATAAGTTVTGGAGLTCVVTFTPA